MEAWIWVVVAIVVVVVVVLRLLARRAVVGRVDPTELLLEPDLVNRVRALAQADQKVAAITLLRAGTPGLGLGPAKLMVDRMAATPRPPVDPPGVGAGPGQG
jgi:ribosomal protein L7/L12